MQAGLETPWLASQQEIIFTADHRRATQALSKGSLAGTLRTDQVGRQKSKQELEALLGENPGFSHPSTEDRTQGFYPKS